MKGREVIKNEKIRKSAEGFKREIEQQKKRKR
jgi:hypothetical protein